MLFMNIIAQGKKSFDKIFFTETDFKNVPEEAKNAMISLPSVTLSTAFFSYGALQVLGPKAISEDKVIILQRFAKVFNQTYTRFIDLQKAEEQARESQIEAALERVRTQAMAMQTSNDLKYVRGHHSRKCYLGLKLIIVTFYCHICEGSDELVHWYV